MADAADLKSAGLRSSGFESQPRHLFRIRYLDSSSGKWHQTWIDVNGVPSYLNGGFEGGLAGCYEGVPPRYDNAGS